MAYEWFKLYPEARVDRKLARLTLAERGVWINLLCYASVQDDRGAFDANDRFLLAVECAEGDEAILGATLEKLEQTRCIERHDALDGWFRFRTFNKRQESTHTKPSDSPERVAERVHKHREQQRFAALQDDVTPCNAPVTPVTPRNATELDEDADAEREVDPERGKISDAAANARARVREASHPADQSPEQPAAAAQASATPTESELQGLADEILTRWKALSQQGKARVPSVTAMRSTLGKHAQRGMNLSDLRTEIDKLEDEAAATDRPLTLKRLDNWLNQWHAPPPDLRPDARPAPARKATTAARPEPPSMIPASKAQDFWNVPPPLTGHSAGHPKPADAEEPATSLTAAAPASADVLALVKPQAPPGVPAGVRARSASA